MGVTDSSAFKVDNCPECGKVYQKNTRNMCFDCVRQIDAEYRACYDFLRRNRKSSVAEVSEAAGVAVERIYQFIREGRLVLSEFPNISLTCELCGAPSRRQKLCDGCASRISEDINSMKEAEQKARALSSSANGFRMNSGR